MVTPRSLSPAVAEARALVQRHGDVGALPELQALWDKHPDEPDIEAYIFLGRLWQGEAEAAEELVRQRIANQPSPGYLGVGSIIAQYLGDLDAVAFRSQLGNEMDADHFLMLWSEIQRYQMLDESAKALSLAERSLELYPNDAEVYGSMIGTLMASSSVQEAKSRLDSAPDWFKRTGDWQRRAGMLAVSDRQLTVAEEHFRLAVADQPSNSMSWANLAMTLRFLGKIDEANQTADIALGINPRNPLALMQKAGLAEAKGQVAEANEFKQRAAVAIPALADQQKLRKALDLKRKNDTQGAIRMLRDLTEHGAGPIRNTARRILIELLFTENLIAEARSELDKTPESFHDDEAHRVDEARILLKEGRQAEAIAIYDDLIHSPSAGPSTFLPLLLHLKDSGDSERLESVADIAERQLLAQVGTPSQCAHLVSVLDSVGQTERAVRCSDFIYRIYSTDPTVRVVRAVLQLTHGDKKDAHRIFATLPPQMRPKIPLGRLLWLVVKRRLFGPKKKK